MFSFCKGKPATGQEVTFDEISSGPSSEYRTAKADVVSAKEALAALRQGNARFVAEAPAPKPNHASLRSALAQDGQNPLAIVVGCADSRCPVETLFDVQPGDLFVLRNAGNTCAHKEGSVIASVEYAVGALGTKLLVVLGHTKCGALAGATKTALAAEAPAQGTDGGKSRLSALDVYLGDLTPAVHEARCQLCKEAGVDEISALAIKMNAFRTIEKLLEFSEPVRREVSAGKVELHAAMYQIESGKVDFLGQHPELAKLLQQKEGTAPEEKLMGA
jgi:carbonic anhydrase